MIEREIKIAFGGVLAESLYLGRKSIAGSGEDAEMILSLVKRLSPDEIKQTDLGGYLLSETRMLLEDNWSLVTVIASSLSESGSLNGYAIRSLARQYT